MKSTSPTTKQQPSQLENSVRKVSNSIGTLMLSWIFRTTLVGVVLLVACWPGNANAQTNAFQWAKRVASTINTDNELSIGLTLDSLGNAYVTGWFDVANNFGGTTLTGDSGGGQDVFVAKYDPTGDLQWARRAGGDSPARDGGRGIGLDNAGNVYATGEFFGTADFGNYTLSTQTNKEFFLVKYNSAGSVQWARQSTGGISNIVHYGTGLAVDGAGNSYAVGYADNGAPITFGTTSLLIDTNGYSTFLVKYDSSGTVQWAQLMGGPGSTYATKVALDDAGNVYVRGTFSGTMTIGASTLVVSGSDQNMFIAKFNSSGALTWVRQATGGNVDEGGVAVDVAQNVYVTGAFDSTVSFSGISLTNAGSLDAFVAKYNGSGAIQWAQRAGGTNLDFYWDVDLDAQGNVYACGALSSNSVPPSGSGGAIIAKYDPAGTLQWAYSASGPPASPAPSIATKVAVDFAGDIFLAGWYRTPTTFGTNVLQTQGYWNYFLTPLASSNLFSFNPPLIVTQPTNQTVTLGQNTNLTVLAVGTLPLRYQWRKDAVNFAGETNTTLNLSNVQTNHAGNYVVVITNFFGSVTSSVAALTVISPPVITSQPQSRTVSVGQSTNFSVTATSTTPLNYQWRKDGVTVGGETNAILNLSNVQTNQAGNYVVVVANFSSSVTSSVAVLTVNSPPNITSQPQSLTVSVGQSASFSVTATGTATLSYQWRREGTNLSGATSATYTVPVAGTDKVGNYTVVVSNVAGSVTSAPPAVLTVNPALPGTVVVWGDNGSFQRNVPAGLSGVTAIAAGYQHTVALKNDGTVAAWSYNGYGQTSVPVGLSEVTAIAAGDRHSVALKSNGTVVAWGEHWYGQTNVPPGLTGVTAIAAGYRDTVALKSDGTVVAWGYNFYGQTTVPSGLTGVTAIAAGYQLTVALKNDGTVVAWGYNWAGQTNVPAGLSEVMAIAAGGSHTVALKSNGTVVAWGYNASGQTNVPAGLSGVTAIAAGFDHTVALKSDGTVVAWGYNASGQTNVPVGLSGVTAIAGGGYHTVALIGSVGAGPTITAHSAGNNLTLLWPVTSAAYRVESALSLSPSITWSNVTGTFQTNGGIISVVLPITGTQKFFRLARP